jgi:nitrogenase molybdenum-iron protein alpha/beta subunit
VDKVRVKSELDSKLRETYEKLCRGETDKSSKRLSKLKCRLDTTTSKFLIIAPLKVEEIHINPLIVVYHNVIYDSEIAVIQKLIKPKVCVLKNSKVTFKIGLVFFPSYKEPLSFMQQR